MREGVAPEDIAVLVRGGAGAAALLAAGARAATASRSRRDARASPLARTRLGAGVLACAPRAALPGGTRGRPADAGCARPGRLADAGRGRRAATPRVRRARGRARRAEARARGSAGSSGRAARRARRARRAAAAGRRRRCSPRSRPRREAIWTAPHRAARRVLGAEDASDARAAARAARRARRRAARASPPPTRAARATPRERARGARRASRCARRAGAPGGVLLADPLAIRARRFRAVFVCGLQDGEFPRRPMPEPFLDDDARAAWRAPPGSCCRATRTCSPRERSLFYACVSRPEEVLFLSLRSSDEEGDPLRAVAVPRRRARAVHRRAVGAARARACSPRSPGRRARRRRRTSCAARTPRPRARPEPPPLGARRADAVLALLAAREPESGARAGDVRRPAACAGSSSACSRPRRVEPDPEPMRRGSLAHAVLERDAAAAAASAPARRALDAGLAAPRRSRSCDAALARAARAARGGARAPRRAARARGRPRALPAPRGASAAPGFEPERLEWSFGGEGDAHGAAAARGAGLRVTGRVDRIDVAAPGSAIVRDYKGRTVTAGARWARGRPAPGRALRAGGARAARARAGRRALPAARRRATCARAGSSATTCPAATSTATSSTPTAFEARARRGARDRGRAPPRDLRAGRIRAVPGALLAARLRLPGDLPRRRARASAAAPRERRSPRFTAEQRAAIADRSRLGAARRQRRLGQDRGDGRALRRGGAATTASPVGAILALTFTEKAAGELRERSGAASTELGRGRARARGRRAPGSARSTASARGCCARSRSPPGLDPRFAVLDEARRRGGSPSAAYERALETLGRGATAPPAVDLAAAYGPDAARR